MNFDPASSANPITETKQAPITKLKALTTAKEIIGDIAAHKFDKKISLAFSWLAIPLLFYPYAAWQKRQSINQAIELAKQLAQLRNNKDTNPDMDLVSIEADLRLIIHDALSGGIRGSAKDKIFQENRAIYKQLVNLSGQTNEERENPTDLGNTEDFITKMDGLIQKKSQKTDRPDKHNRRPAGGAGNIQEGRNGG